MIKRRATHAAASGLAIGLFAAGAALAADSSHYTGFTSQHSRINLVSIHGQVGLTVGFHKRCRNPRGGVVPDILSTYHLPSNSHVLVDPAGDFSLTLRDRRRAGGNSALSPEQYYVVDTFRISAHLDSSSASGTFRIVQKFHQTAGGSLLDRCTSGEVHFQAELR